RRSSRDDDDYDDRRPRRSSRDYDDDYDDDYDRGRRRGGRGRFEEGGNAPKILGILSCVFCIPCYGICIIGIILGLIGLILAMVELNNLPESPYTHDKRKNLQLGRTLCIVGMCLSVGLVLVFCMFYFTLLAGAGMAG